MSTGQLLRGVPHEAYHKDIIYPDKHFDVEKARAMPPRLSRSIATKLLNESPLHAWGAHPRLGGAPSADDTAASDAGSLLHGLLLGGAAEVAVCMIPPRDSKGQLRQASPAWETESALTASLRRGSAEIPARDWLTKDAQRFAATARAEGRLPVLLHELAEAKAIVGPLREQLDEATDGVFGDDDGDTEVTALWKYGGVACKARLDHLLVKRGQIIDLKFLADAHPASFGRSMRAKGYDMQHAASRAAVEAAYPSMAGRVDFQFVCVEVNPRTRIPIQIGGRFLISLPRVGATMRDLGEQRWRRAVATWGACLYRQALGEPFAVCWPCYDEGDPIEARSYELEDEMHHQLVAAGEPDWAEGAGS